LNYVFYLSSDWETFHRPDMIYAFARQIRPHGGKLLCVDRMMCPFTGPLRGVGTGKGNPSRGLAKWRKSMTRLLTGGNTLEPLADNLYLGRAFVALDDRFALRSEVLSRLNRRILGRQVKGMIRRLGMEQGPIVTWFHFPMWVGYHGMLGETLSVYECYDQHVAIAGVDGQRAQLVERCEKELFSKVDLVFCTSHRLKEIKAAFHDRIHHVPNGADFHFYSRVQDDSVIPDPEFAHLPRPRIGYLGTINEHTDLDLIEFVARSRPEWSILLAGKLDQRAAVQSDTFRALSDLPNVRILGWLDRDRIPAICKCFDVCMIPYRQDSTFNRYVNPNKLHEYTAMGKPIVALEGVDVASHRDLIRVAGNREEFLAALAEAYETDSQDSIARRLEIAERNSWDARTREMIARVDSVLESDSAGTHDGSVKVTDRYEPGFSGGPTQDATQDERLSK